MLPTRTALTLGVVICFLPAHRAAATTYFDRAAFNAAFLGLPTQDFEGAGPQQRDYGDFVLVSGTNLGAAVGTSTNGFPSRAAICFNSDDTLDIVFAQSGGVQAVGFQVGCFDFFDAHALDCYVAVFSPSGTLLVQVL